MSRGKPYVQWKKLVLEWQASGKTSKAWCEENKIPMNTLSGWKRRLKKSELNNSPIKPKAKFIELKNPKLSESGIFLECDGIKIHLNPQFDPRTLKQCISCLRGV